MWGTGQLALSISQPAAPSSEQLIDWFSVPMLPASAIHFAGSRNFRFYLVSGILSISQIREKPDIGNLNLLNLHVISTILSNFDCASSHPLLWDVLSLSNMMNLLNQRPWHEKMRPNTFFQACYTFITSLLSLLSLNLYGDPMCYLLNRNLLPNIYFEYKYF